MVIQFTQIAGLGADNASGIRSAQPVERNKTACLEVQFFKIGMDKDIRSHRLRQNAVQLALVCHQLDGARGADAQDDLLSLVWGKPWYQGRVHRHIRDTQISGQKLDMGERISLSGRQYAGNGRQVGNGFRQEVNALGVEFGHLVMRRVTEMKLQGAMGQAGIQAAKSGPDLLSKERMSDSCQLVRIPKHVIQQVRINKKRAPPQLILGEMSGQGFDARQSLLAFMKMKPHPPVPPAWDTGKIIERRFVGVDRHRIGFEPGKRVRQVLQLSVGDEAGAIDGIDAAL